MFDLDRYLARIDLPARPTLCAEGLGRLQRQHRLAIPFENLDVVLGRDIAIASAPVFAKLVGARRGGYCFEHGRLFADALEALGFRVRPLLARVWLGAAEVPPLSHTLALVTLPDGAQWIADAGFGGSDTPAMPLVEGAQAQAPDGARFALRRDADHGWLLLRDGDPATTDGREGRQEQGGREEQEGGGWRRQYSFDLRTVHEADLAMGNLWASRAPASRFTHQPIVSIVLPHGFATLTGRQYRRRAAETDAAGEIADPRVYRMRLAMMFGIELARDEVAALGLFG